MEVDFFFIWLLQIVRYKSLNFGSEFRRIPHIVKLLYEASDRFANNYRHCPALATSKLLATFKTRKS